MARIIHTEEAATTAREVAVLLTKDESPEHPGITKRYCGLMGAAVMVAYIFKPRGTRYGIRVLSEAEKEAYQRERAFLDLACGI